MCTGVKANQRQQINNNENDRQRLNVGGHLLVRALDFSLLVIRGRHLKGRG